MRRLFFTLIFVFTVNFVFAKDSVYYTAPNNMSYLSFRENDEKQKGLAVSLAQVLIKNVGYEPVFVNSDYYFNAIDNAKIGSNRLENKIDLITGVYFDSKLNEYFEYVYPHYFEDPIIMVVNKKIKDDIVFNNLSDLKRINNNYTAVILRNFYPGAWFDNIKNDLENVYNGTKTYNQVKKFIHLKEKENINVFDFKNKKRAALRYVETDTIDQALAKLFKGNYYFIGSALMVMDSINRNKHLNLRHNLEFIPVVDNGEYVKRKIYLAVSRKSKKSAVFSKVSLAENLSEEMLKFKENDDLDKLIYDVKKQCKEFGLCR